MTTSLDRDGVWEAIDSQRTHVADLLEQLTDTEWAEPSLCRGWSVRDVAAHLTLQQITWGDALRLMVKYRGDTNRAIHESARERAAVLSTADIIAGIRDMVGSRRHNAAVSHRETLIDALVHGQDIAIPLGRDLMVAPVAAAEATTRMWTMRFPPPFPPIKRMRGFRLVATDVDWSVGDGPEVHAPIAAMMLVSCGRTVALPQLTGPGATDLVSRFQ